MRNRNRRSRMAASGDGSGGLVAAVARHPREFVGIVMGTAAVLAIFVNALFLQHGPHPAPIFAARQPLSQTGPIAIPRPRPAEPVVTAAPAARSQAQTVGDIQRALLKKGFYEGRVDAVWDAKTDAAVRDFIDAAGVKVDARPNEALLHAIATSDIVKSSAPAQNDPIAALIAPSQRITAIQRALTDFGYGQFNPSGVYDPATKGAIEKFERDRHLPVTGVISTQLVQELSTVTGRPLE